MPIDDSHSPEPTSEKIEVFVTNRVLARYDTI